MHAQEKKTGQRPGGRKYLSSQCLCNWVLSDFSNQHEKEPQIKVRGLAHGGALLRKGHCLCSQRQDDVLANS